MKIKPTNKSGGVAVKLGPKEAQLPGASETRAPVFNLKKILVPVDFSDCSKKALQYAIPFARQFDAKLTLLHVVEPYPPTPQMAAVDPEHIQEMRKAGEKELKSLRRMTDDRVPSEFLLRVGNPYIEINKVAKQLGIDLIILTTHGRTGLAHVFLGSTAERVVRHAGCPVLVVREREHEFVRPASASKAARTREAPTTAGSRGSSL